MRLGHIELFCRDQAATQAFYVDVLGFEETEIQGGNVTWLRLDDADILLRPGRKKATDASYTDSSQALVFYCDDLLDLMERLENSGTKLGEPDGAPDCLTFQDPDGRWIQAVEKF
ncbi:MAG: VOC family protein [Armatimonadetes bacterium]|nr:VOC family protein [Armatimonadota bacterium]